MQQQPSDRDLEHRVAYLEGRVAELEEYKRASSDRDAALLVRIDHFIEDLRLIQREQIRSFDSLQSGQQELRSRMDSMERNLVIIIDTMRDHKAAIEHLDGTVNGLAVTVNALADGQAEILMLLRGPQKRND
jgi:hypothetical protein